ncbi:MAG: hypothetical protein QM778_14730 [Myxococcales bacterium]
MKPNESERTGMAWEGSGDRARQIMREYRGLLIGYSPVPDLEERTSEERTRGKAKAPAVADLPAEIRQLFDRFEREHPRKVEPIAYITAGGSDGERSVSQFAELPPEDELVILALTETVASADRVEVRSQVLLVRQAEKR